MVLTPSGVDTNADTVLGFKLQASSSIQLNFELDVDFVNSYLAFVPVF